MTVATRIWLSGLMGALVVAAWADSRIRIVAVSFIEHRVEVQRPANAGSDGELRWTPAMLNQPVVEGESIRTDFNAQAEVQLECGSALRIAPNSELRFPHLRLRDDGVRSTTVQLVSGEAYFTLQDSDSRDFHVLLPGGEVFTGDGGVKLRLEAPAGQPATLEVMDGQVRVNGGRRVEVVKAKRRVALLPGGGFTTLAMAAPDQWQQWSHERDDAFQRAVLAHAPGTDVDAKRSLPQPAMDAPLPVLTPDNASTLFQALDATHPDPNMAPRVSPRMAPYCAHQ